MDLKGQAEHSSAKSLPVLIADDHPVNQKILFLILDKLGYASIPADNGGDALEKAASNEVALVFMDIQMPGMNGYEAARKLRSRGFTRPIIAVTAGILSDEWERCRAAGIDDLLLKPFKRDDVEKMLRRWINGRRNAAEMETGEALPVPVSVSAERPDIIPSASVRQYAVLNTAELLDALMNNMDMILPLLARFIDRTESQLDAIPDLEKAGDMESALREVHTIKGAARTMGGEELGGAAARMELACKNNDKNEMKTAYPLLKEAFGRFKKEAEAFISRSRS